MKVIKKVILSILLLTSFLVLYLIYHFEKTVEFNPGPEYEYSALKNVKMGKHTKIREYILLADSTKLAVTTLLPKKSDTEKFPTILVFTPYSSSVVVPNMTWIEKLKSKFFINNWGPAYEMMLDPKVISTLISNGYAISMVDMRGTGSSTGSSAALDPIHIEDSKEVLQWVAYQSWSNQNIGMMGLSYYGWSQFAAASTNSPYLKCIAPEAIFFNSYTEAIRPGGIYAQKWLTGYSKMIELKNNNLWNNSFPAGSAFPSEPVLDEDGDLEIHDEIPILGLNSDSLDLYHQTKLEYRDGKQRTNSFYASLTKQHSENLRPYEVAKQITYINDTIHFKERSYPAFSISTDYLISKIKETQIPVLLVGGFFDGFSQGTLQSAASLQKTNDVYVFMTPRFHLPWMSGPYWEWLNYTYSHIDQLNSMYLQFFDKYLKGINNDLDEKPPIRIYTAFEGWEYFNTWPPDNNKLTQFNFGPDYRLQTKRPDDSIVYKYDVDFTHSSSYNKSGINPMLMYMYSDSLMVRNEHDKKSLVFESKVLDSHTKVTGHPIVELHVTSNRNNADVYVYLSDIDSLGNAYYVSEGKLRAGWHKLVDNDVMVNHLYDVKPDLPWHSYRKEDYDPAPLNMDSVCTLKFVLKPISWKFRKGHKIRISIAGADLNNYELNPNLCEDNKFENCLATQLKIHSSFSQPSNITLPIIN